MKYELAFEGAGLSPYFPKRYKRHHTNLDSVRKTALSVKQRLDCVRLPQGGTITASHYPQVYDKNGNLVYFKIDWSAE